MLSPFSEYVAMDGDGACDPLGHPGRTRRSGFFPISLVFGLCDGGARNRRRRAAAAENLRRAVEAARCQLAKLWENRARATMEALGLAIAPVRFGPVAEIRESNY